MDKKQKKDKVTAPTSATKDATKDNDATKKTVDAKEAPKGVNESAKKDTVNQPQKTPVKDDIKKSPKQKSERKTTLKQIGGRGGKRNQ